MFLYGASGHGKVIASILKANGIEISGFFDDNKDLKNYMGFRVGHHYEGQSPIIISIGRSLLRKNIVERLADLNVEYGKVIHPSAIIAPCVNIGEGSVIMPAAVIQPDTKIGRHCIVNTGAIIEHECVLGDFVHVAPRVTMCGDVNIGEGSWIGVSSTIIQGVRIGKWCFIGAGSLVTEDIPDGYLAYGTPCKLVKAITPEYFK